MNIAHKFLQITTIIIVSVSIVFSVEIPENVFRIGKRSDNIIHAWVFFKDKGVSKDKFTETIHQIESSMNDRTRFRRAKVRSEQIVDEKDIQVRPVYIQQVKDKGGQIRTVSKWLNGVSIEAPEDVIQQIGSLDCVKKIQPVFAGKRRKVISGTPNNNDTNNNQTVYGSSFTPLNQINLIAAHEAGYTGQGVVVLMLDTGYYKDHEAIQNDKIIGEWDFINNDGETQNETGDNDGQHNHGTVTLSVLGGWKDSVLVGAAYDAEVLLAKTEDITDEQPIEEDYYVAGLEWGEANGADIASSSLGYIDWYDFEDLDGNTAITTIAVNQAIENGMIVTTAAGNGGESGIIAPADAMNVIACGAVDSLGTIATFSSRGPTADDRIKPEVCAQGVATFCAGSYHSEYYFQANGTSLSTPLIGGACAVILSAHPDWTPLMVREALMMTASQSEYPNNEYGWGVIDVMAAINYTGFATVSEADPIPAHFMISDPYPNPFNSSVKFTVAVKNEGLLTVDVVNICGEIVETLWKDYRDQGNHDYIWESNSAPSGSYFIRAELNKKTSIRKISLVK